MRLGDLVEGLSLSGVSPAALSVRVCDLTEDSRTVLPGSLFIARSGTKVDGRSFIAGAIDAGAVAILTDAVPDTQAVPSAGIPILISRDIAADAATIAERFFGNPTAGLRIAAVTGTNGKTTISYLIWRMLNALDDRCGLVGTVLIDDGREVGRADMTTPPAIELSRIMASMVEGGCGAAAIEASSHALDQKRVDGIRIAVGIFTNLTGDHLDYHKTIDHYAASKARLFGMLPSDGLAIVNASDASTDRMLIACRAPVLRCAMRTGAAGTDEAVCEIVRVARTSSLIRLAGPWGDIAHEVPLIGTYNAMNLLQAFAATQALRLRAGLSFSARDQKVALAAASAPPGRLQPLTSAAGCPAVLIDYAHTDDALRNALGAVRASLGASGASGRLWCVFGAGGNKDRTKRPRMGRAVAELADVAVVTSDNPRHEEPLDIIEEIVAGMNAAQRASSIIESDRARAIEHAIATAGSGDVVVIAGKGHETEQIISDGRGGLISNHFDDAETATIALARRSGEPVVVVTKVATGGRA